MRYKNLLFLRFIIFGVDLNERILQIENDRKHAL